MAKRDVTASTKVAASVADPERLLAWYDRHRRDLPWRAKLGKKPDPYAVWLSEIMLQQTTVATVGPYYAAFLARWPRVEDLAAAPMAEVMKLWAGLGYYSRARNLHACAKVVATKHQGQFPSDEALLLDLPGVGSYTAAAIAAIAFGRRAIVIDGNVERVIARLHAIDEPAPSAKKVIRAYAEQLTPSDRAGDFAQAMMDLGAGVCTPRNPACTRCPLNDACIAERTGKAGRYPVKAPKRTRPRRAGAAFYVRRADGAILTRTRPPKGLLGGMVELPGTEWTEHFNCAQALGQAPITAQWRPLAGEIEHVFTHFSLALTLYLATAPANTQAPAGMRWTPEAELDGEALPTLFRKAIAYVRARDKFSDR